MVRGGGSKRGRGEGVRGGRGRGRGRQRGNERGDYARIVLIGERRRPCSIQSQSSGNGSSESERRDDTQSQRSASIPPSQMCLTEIAQMCTDGSVDEEAESSHSLVTVGGYGVKPDVAPLLGHIFAKYGDIAGESDLHSLEARSYFFGMVCSIIQKLQRTSFKALSSAELTRMLGNVQDLEKVKFKVGWLREKLEDIEEVKKLIGNYPFLKKEKTKIEEKKQQLKSFEAELAALQKDIPRIKQELQEMTDKYEEGNQKYAKMQSKIRDAFQKDLVDGLL